MFKLRQMILMLCFIFSGALCYAYSEEVTENAKDNEGGITIGMIEKSSQSHSDKSGSIIPYINGHMLSVVFCENLGQIYAEVTTITGTVVDFTSVLTPNGLQVYISNAGNYIVTFTFSDGDEYYGDFTVMD